MLILVYGNLRGLREAGRVFAVPAYLFIGAVGLMLAVGLARWAFGDLPHADVHARGVVPLGTAGDGWLYGASLFIVLRAFANGGSSRRHPDRLCAGPDPPGPARAAHRDAS